MSKTPDLLLISSVVLFDDRRAFGLLVERYQSAVRRYLLHLTGGDQMLADDLAQESFLKVYLNLKSFQGISSFSTWLFRIAYYQYLDFVKVQKNQMGAHLPLDLVEQVGYQPSDRQELRMDLRQAIGQLKPDERSAILLYYMEEMSIKEIAKVMQLPEGTVKSHLARGRDNLGNYLNDTDYEKSR